MCVCVSKQKMVGEECGMAGDYDYKRMVESLKDISWLYGLNSYTVNLMK